MIIKTALAQKKPGLTLNSGFKPDGTPTYAVHVKSALSDVRLGLWLWEMPMFRRLIPAGAPDAASAPAGA